MIGHPKEVRNIKKERINGKRVKTYEVWTITNIGWVFESKNMANRRTSDEKIIKAYKAIIGYCPPKKIKRLPLVKEGEKANEVN
jgi:hypothetical protein